jgi:hypothetical protein
MIQLNEMDLSAGVVQKDRINFFQQFSPFQFSLAILVIDLHMFTDFVPFECTHQIERLLGLDSL